ncbi:MAG TPA: ABC transporter permease [Rhabdaerophilum sp.]|nr:ABC transporter permease [Rhabdaerophilum sp.]
MIGRALRHPSFLIGAVLSLLICAVAVLSLFWTPEDPTKMRILMRLKGPSGEFWLGTDQFGRDVASMLMVGARNALLTGFVAVAIGAGFGLMLGVTAAQMNGRWADDAIMRALDFIFAFPAVLSAILILTFLGPGLVNTVIAIGVFNVPVFARVARGATLQVLTRDFIRAARLARVPRLVILRRHVLPNIAGLMIVQASTQFALAILAEAGLSYLGLGTQPPNPSWGRMLNDAQTFLGISPRLALLPGLAIAVSVLAFNLLGDGLRDILDPRLEER